MSGPRVARDTVLPRERRQRLTRAEQKAETRRRLLDAAAEVFLRRGFQGASVEEISDEAGFTRGAFYSNFESKEELFVELLQERVYSVYRAVAEQAVAQADKAPNARETGDQLAAIQANTEARWLFRLWFECLAQATRDDALRELAAGFWRGNRALGAEVVRRRDPRLADQAKAIATALIALDIGLAIQHFVDPDDVPLSYYPDLYELLFGRLARRTAKG